jgi:hypothetical protein
VASSLINIGFIGHDHLSADPFIPSALTSMKKVGRYFLLIIFFLTACFRINEYEKNNIDSLNLKFPIYSFTGTGDVYLNVEIGNENIDTTKLQEIFNYAILKKDSTGKIINEYRDDLSWVYLNIYRDRKFLFQLSKNIYTDNEFIILKSQYY